MCDCRTRMNERLKPSNARLASAFMVSGGKLGAAPPMIEVEKIDPKSRKKIPSVLATYCPFCGEKFKD